MSRADPPGQTLRACFLNIKADPRLKLTGLVFKILRLSGNWSKRLDHSAQIQSALRSDAKSARRYTVLSEFLCCTQFETCYGLGVCKLLAVKLLRSVLSC